jgi:hypothetical protein
MIKTIQYRGKWVRLNGRRASDRFVTVQRFRRIAPSLPPPPASTNWFASVGFDWGAEGNDVFGDCPYAAASKLRMLKSASIGGGLVLSAASTEADYCLATGCNGVPGDPTDQGDTVEHMISWYQSKGAFGQAHDISPSNPKHMMQANAYIIGGPNFGLCMPDEWVENQDLDVWDVAGPPNPDNGHDVMGLDYVASGNYFVIDTWNFRKHLTFAAILKYATVVTAIDAPCGYRADGTNAANFTTQQVNADIAAL